MLHKCSFRNQIRHIIQIVIDFLVHFVILNYGEDVQLPDDQDVEHPGMEPVTPHKLPSSFFLQPFAEAYNIGFSLNCSKLCWRC